MLGAVQLFFDVKNKEKENADWFSWKTIHFTPIHAVCPACLVTQPHYSCLCCVKFIFRLPCWVVCQSPSDFVRGAFVQVSEFILYCLVALRTQSNLLWKWILILNVWTRQTFFGLTQRCGERGIITHKLSHKFSMCWFVCVKQAFSTIVNVLQSFLHHLT